MDLTERAHRGVWIAGLVVGALILPASAQAQQGPVPVLGGDGAAIRPPTSRADAADERPGTGRAAPAFDDHSILLDLPRLSLQAPRTWADHAVIDEVSFAEDAPGSIVTTYRGIPSIILRRVLGYYRERFTDTIHARWLGSSDTIFDIERRITAFHDAESDLRAGGSWGGRTWRQALEPSRGGAPAEPRRVTVGREVEILRLGELALTNEGRMRVGRLSLYLDDDRIYEQIQKTADAILGSSGKGGRPPEAGPARSDKEKERDRDKLRASLLGENRVDLTVALDREDDAQVEMESLLRGTTRERVRRAGRFVTPRGSLLTGEGWNLSCHPNLRLKLPGRLDDYLDAVSYAAVELDLNLYPGETRRHGAVLTVTFSAEPSTGEYRAVATFEVVRW